MNPIALTAGLVCIIGGIVGAGLKAGGYEIPALSPKRQLVLIIFGVIVLAFAGAAASPDPSASQQPTKFVPD